MPKCIFYFSAFIEMYTLIYLPHRSGKENWPHILLLHRAALLFLICSLVIIHGKVDLSSLLCVCIYFCMYVCARVCLYIHIYTGMHIFCVLFFFLSVFPSRPYPPVFSSQPAVELPIL